MHHRNIVPDDNHGIFAWEVADATALAALTVSVDDIGKVAHQLSPIDFLVLEDDTGPVWTSIRGGGGGGGYGDSDVLALFDVTGAAPVYPVRAYINMDGTGTITTRRSKNISAITDLGTGTYRFTFATAMPNADYVINAVSTISTGAFSFIAPHIGEAPTASTFVLRTYNVSFVTADSGYVYASINY